MPRRSGPDRATLLAAVGLAVAIVALLLNFVLPGPVGPQGTAGGAAAGSSLWAVVNTTGWLDRGYGVQSVSQLPGVNGQYVVTFDQDISNCAYVATLGTVSFGGAVPAGYVSVGQRAGTSDSVYVATYNVTGVPVNEAFHLSVQCAPQLFAVVSATGSSVRENGVVAMKNLGAGSYEVDFNQNVTDCAILATPGLTGSSSSEPPFAITTVASRDGVPNGVFVATYSGTGARANQSFHLALVCSATLWAVVNSDGSLARSQNVISSAGLIAGSYQVLFNQNLTRCAFVATVGMPGSGVAADSTITVAGRSGNDFGVYIQTTSSTGVATSEPFHLAVFC